MRAMVSLAAAVIILSLNPRTIHADVIALHGDSLQTSTCDGGLSQPDILAVFYLFHHSSEGATGSRFVIPRPDCLDFGGVYGPNLVQSAFASTGNLESGIEFQYGACLSGWIFVAVVAYIDWIGLTSGSCCEQPIHPHPDATSGQVEAFDCDNVAKGATPRRGIVGVTSSCPCDTVTGIHDDTLYGTWGSIKALYH